jgi:propanol-preferring alcohol dehydrogenase
MKAMVLDQPADVDSSPLALRERETPKPAPGEVLVRVEACGVCRTDLHIVEGELPPHKQPVIPGHMVVGRVEARGEGATAVEMGQRVGVAWLYQTDQTCRYCRREEENLCVAPAFTGYDRDGGYAEYLVARADFIYPLPESIDPVKFSPFLCAGIIGYRALKRSEVKRGERLGLYGFGNSAHINIQVAQHWGCETYVSTRDPKHQELARRMGATWVGGPGDTPPEKLNAAILFAPAGPLVPPILEALDAGGTLAIADIYLTDVPSLNYERHVFHEKTLRSVTSNTRQDGRELLELAVEIPLHTEVETFPLEQANEALRRLKQDEINGAAVLVMG